MSLSLARGKITQTNVKSRTNTIQKEDGTVIETGITDETTWDKDGVVERNIIEKFEDGAADTTRFKYFPDEGLYEVFYESGKVWQEIYAKDGVLHGSYTVFYESGNVWEEMTNQNGKREGPFKKY